MEIPLDILGALNRWQPVIIQAKYNKHIIKNIIEHLFDAMLIDDFDYYINTNHCLVIQKDDKNNFLIILKETLEYIYGSELPMDDFLDLIYML